MFPPEFVVAGQCPVYQVERAEDAKSSAPLTAQQLIDSLRTGDRALAAAFHAHGVSGERA